MDDEEREPGFDPATLLPFVCWLEPEDEAVEKLPKTFGNMDQPVDSGDSYVP